MNVDVLKALSDESRLRILNVLMRGKLCVCEIEEVLEISQSNVSRHLNKLKIAKIIKMTKEAQWSYYEIHEDFIRNHQYLYLYLKHSFEHDKSLKKDMHNLVDLKANAKCVSLKIEK